MTKILSVLTPFLLFGVFSLMDGGHGVYEPGIFIFPNALISFSIFNRLEIPFIILAIFQYPAYGLVVDRSNNKFKATFLLLAHHTSLVIFIFLTTKDL